MVNISMANPQSYPTEKSKNPSMHFLPFITEAAYNIFK
jgi:hypothetical protein